MAVAIKRLQRVGNSTGIVLPPEILKVAGLGRSDEVVVHVEAGVITLRRLDPDFDKLVAAADRFVAAYPNALRKLGQ